MAPLSRTCTPSRIQAIPSYLLRREGGGHPGTSSSSSCTQPLPPQQHFAGVLYLSSPTRPNEGQTFLLSAPQALLVAAHRPKDTGPAHRLLPFFFGTCFGALGLAAWEANTPPASPPQQPPSPHQPLATQPPGFSWLGQQTLSSTPATSSPTSTGFSASSTGAWPLGANSLRHLNSSLEGSGSASSSSSSSAPMAGGSSSGGGLAGSSISNALGALARGGSSLIGGALHWPGLGVWGQGGSSSSSSSNLQGADPQSASPPPLPPISNSALPPPLPPPQPCASAPHSPQGGGALHSLNSSPQPFCASSTEQQQGAPLLPLTRSSISDASSRASPAVVHLMVENQGPQGSSHQQQQQQWQHQDSHSIRGMGGMNVVGPGRSSGSGFVYDERGYIVTNAHVVAAAADEEEVPSAAAAEGGSNSHKAGAQLGWGFSSHSGTRSRSRAGNKPVLTVTLQDGRILQGRVVCLDKAADVAVVKVDSSEPLPVAPMGSSSKLRVGEWVVALGSPLMLKHSVTAGIVSCVERRGRELGLPASRSPYIQTDVAINQGNSGGPLINLDGEVVGMSMMKAYEADGVSFCLPISTIQEIVASFATHGRMRYPYVGITMVELTQSALKHLQDQLPAAMGSAPAAIMIQSVREGTPAEAAGLQPEDLIVSIDGRSPLSMSDIVEHFGANIQQPCHVGFMRRATNANGSRGPYTLMGVQLTPEEVPVSD